MPSGLGGDRAARWSFSKVFGGTCVKEYKAWEVTVELAVLGVNAGFLYVRELSARPRNWGAEAAGGELGLDAQRCSLGGNV